MNSTRSLTFTPKGYYEAVGTAIASHAYRGSASRTWANGWIRNTGAGNLFVAFMDSVRAPEDDTAKETVAPGEETFFERVDLDQVFTRSEDAGVSGETVADEAARLALTGIVKYYVVFQDDTNVYWQFTGTDPSEAGDWTSVGATLTAVGFELHGTSE